MRILNSRGHDWTAERLHRAIHWMVREKLVEPELIARSPRRPPEAHLMKLVAGIAIADPDLSLRDIAAQLDQMRGRRRVGAVNGNRPPSGHSWRRARRFGLVRS